MSGTSYADRLRLIGILTGPAVRQAIRGMRVAKGTTGLDVGCGAGEKTLWFAEEIGSSGCVIGVDTSAEHLAVARASAVAAGLSGRFRFQPGDLHHLPFEDASFDWAWSADTLWPVPGIDPLAGVAELRRVVKPGGSVGLLFWSNQSLLPGYPVLEAQLNLAHAEENPYLVGVPPHLHFLRALGWLRAAGLEELSSGTWAAHHQVPLSDEKRHALIECFRMFWGDVAARVPEKDWDVFRRLSDPASGECILDSPDYACSVTYALFRGRVPEAGRRRSRGDTRATRDTRVLPRLPPWSTGWSNLPPSVSAISIPKDTRFRKIRVLGLWLPDADGRSACRCGKKSHIGDHRIALSRDIATG